MRPPHANADGDLLLIMRGPPGDGFRITFCGASWRVSTLAGKFGAVTLLSHVLLGFPVGDTVTLFRGRLACGCSDRANRKEATGMVRKPCAPQGATSNWRSIQRGTSGQIRVEAHGGHFADRWMGDKAIGIP